MPFVIFRKKERVELFIEDKALWPSYDLDPPPPPPPLDRRHTGRLRKRNNLLTEEGGRGGGGAKTYDGGITWSSINN